MLLCSSASVVAGFNLPEPIGVPITRRENCTRRPVRTSDGECADVHKVLSWRHYPGLMLLYLHGADGFYEDGPLASGLAEETGSQLMMPHLPNEDMSFEGWAAPVRQALGALGPDDLVAGHSFGGSILVKVLAEQIWPVRQALLLAMPNWGADGWDVLEYRLDGRMPQQSLSLHHCADDAVVPLSHLALNSADLPTASVKVHATGGHQFDGQIAALLV